jgi:hypothetical protein
VSRQTEEARRRLVLATQNCAGLDMSSRVGHWCATCEYRNDCDVPSLIGDGVRRMRKPLLYEFKQLADKLGGEAAEQILAVIERNKD